jgi:hypothetical protein
MRLAICAPSGRKFVEESWGTTEKKSWSKPTCSTSESVFLTVTWIYKHVFCICDGVSFIDHVSPDHVFVASKEKWRYKRNGCSRDGVSEVFCKDGWDVAPMGTESSTVMWSHNVPGRIKEHKGVFASLQKIIMRFLTVLTVAGTSRTAFCVPFKELLLCCCIWQLQTKEVILPGNGLVNTSTNVS